MGRISPTSAHLSSAPNSLAVGSSNVWAQRVGRRTQRTSRACSKTLAASVHCHARGALSRRPLPLVSQDHTSRTARTLTRGPPRSAPSPSLAVRNGRRVHSTLR
jgi:hypothetical protein